jgi:glycerol-3-phosphate acyltransferase PlsY
MNKTRKALIRSAVTALAASAVLALSSLSAMAQCVMCRASIGQNSVFARNLNIGVLVLLVPPVAMFCTIFVLAIRHRKSG